MLGIAEHVERAFGPLCLEHTISLTGEHHLQRAPDVLLVVDDEHGGRDAGAFAGFTQVGVHASEPTKLERSPWARKRSGCADGRPFTELLEKSSSWHHERACRILSKHADEGIASILVLVHLEVRFAEEHEGFGFEPR